MGFFNKNSEETPRPRNEKAMLTIRAIAAAYLFYLVYDMISNYVKDPTSGDLWVVIGGSIFLVAGGIFVAIVTYKDYKRMQKREAEEYLAALEEREAAEAAAAAEEAEAEEEEIAAPETEPEE